MEQPFTKLVYRENTHFLMFLTFLLLFLARIQNCVVHSSPKLERSCLKEEGGDLDVIKMAWLKTGDLNLNVFPFFHLHIE